MSTYNLNGKIAIVTGAGSGIGHALAELLLQAGSNVLPTNKSGPAALFHKTDVPDWAQLTDLWETAIKVFGQIDIVGKVAGIFEPPSSSFWKLPGISPASEDKADASSGSYKTISINYMAPVRLAQMAIDYWSQNPRIKGNFVAVSSMAAYLHNMGTPLYMSSKAGLVSFIKSIGEVNDHVGIRISAVCPGVVITPLLKRGFGEDAGQEDRDLTSPECAGVILRVLQEPQWERGSIVETYKAVTERGAEITVRDVELEALYPRTESLNCMNPRISEAKSQILAQLNAKGT